MHDIEECYGYCFTIVTYDIQHTTMVYFYII